MKKNIFIKGVAGVLAAAAMAPAMTSCSDNYLEESPITSIGKEEVQNTLEELHYTMQGACSSMYSQRRTGGWNNTCGEPYFNIMYGEATGNTFHDRIWNVYASNISDWTQMRSQTSMMASYMWSYCYGLINAVNQVLDAIDDVPLSFDEATKKREIAERDFIKAASLSVRAHAYTKLLQVYGPRWQDSQNGAVNSGVVLRLKAGQGDEPFATTGQVMDQIYADLDNAIALFEGTTYNDGLIWTPSLNVAHGLKARIAAIKCDWATVRSEAKAARAGHAIMSAAQYVKGGFVEANQEYLWATWFQNEGMYYDGHGGTYGCNGWTVHSWGVSSGIDFDLYRNIPMTDCRKGLYIAPGFFSLPENQQRVQNAIADEWINAPVNDNSFFDANTINEASVTFGGNLVEFVNSYGCDSSILPNVANLTSAFNDGICRPYVYADYMVSGLQYKFWGVDTFATNQFPYMRASEMGYLEAEAAYMLGDEAGAQALMEALNKDVRDPNFTCTETGDALLQKIRTYRHIELWGEGFTWFDYKRWNTTMHRSQWVEGDPTSGNYTKNLAKDYAPDAKEGWRVSVPISEFNYNKAISVDELPGYNR